MPRSSSASTDHQVTETHPTSAGPSSSTAAIDGWFTLDEKSPSLIGSRCLTCRTYVFPPASLACPNPDCDSVSFEAVRLSRHGRIWSYTDARYQPPAPYVASDPYEPFCLAAVELAEERLVVLGQVVPGFTVEDLHVGMEVELVLAPLHSGTHSGEVVIYKWRPVSQTHETADR
jgi:uncharacterized protein